MFMKRTFVWALIALPLFVACDDDDKIISNDNEPAITPIALQDVVGSWHLTLATVEEVEADTLVVESDGRYKYSYTYSPIEDNRPKPFYQLFEDGDYTVNGNLLIDNVTLSRERYATIVDDIKDAWWDTLSERIDTVRVRFLLNRSVMIHEYFKGPATPTSKDIKHIALYFRQGASNLPSDESTLQGIWYWKEKANVVSAAVRFDADSVEVYLGKSYGGLWKGAYVFEDGVVSVGKTTKYVSRNSEGKDDINANAPFDSHWLPIDTAKENNFFRNGISFPFIIDGNTAYSQFDSGTPIFTKQ